VAHDVSDASPYAALQAAHEAVLHPSFLLVKDPGGLYISEDISDSEPVLLESACLFVQWAVDQMREQYGCEAAAELLDCLFRGCQDLRATLRGDKSGG